MHEFIDPEELPFTEDEVFEAAQLLYPVDEAKMTAAHLAQCGPGMIEARKDRRASWKAGGMPLADSMPLHAWVYPSDLLAALAALRGDVALRACFLAEAEWQERFRAELTQLQQRALEQSGLVPTREQMISQARADATDERARRQLETGLASSGPPLPMPTTEMVRQVYVSLAARRAAWSATVERLRGKLIHPSR